MEDETRKRSHGARHTTAALLFATLPLGFGGQVSADAAQSPAEEPASETREHGLRQVPIRGAGTFWVHPDADLRAYDRVALEPLRLEYKKNPRRYRIDRLSTGVLLTQRDEERLQQAFYDVFKRGLANGAGFGPASEADPGLLWVSASLVDVVVRYNRDPSPDDLAWVHDYGEMTLRIDFTDSQSGELLARFQERRIIRPSADFNDNLFRRDTFSYWTAVRANLSRWSELVRRRMHDQRTGSVRF